MSYKDIPSIMTEVMPLEGMLRVIGFERDLSGIGFTQHLDGIEFTIVESMFCWFLSRRFMKRSDRSPFQVLEVGVPYDIRIEANVAPIEVKAIMYDIWCDVYPNRELNEPSLIWGKEWRDFQKEMKSLIPKAPTLWAEREFLRQCFNYIEQHHDWIDQDYDIKFSQVAGQVKVCAMGMEIYCPAKGNWVGEVTVAAKALFRSLPKRFTGQYVTLSLDGADTLIINGQKFIAQWLDKDEGNYIFDREK